MSAKPVDTKPEDAPTEAQLRAAAKHSYGTSCSQIFCKAGGGLSGGFRDLELPDDLQAKRDPDGEGTWITARIWISDEDAT